MGKFLGARRSGRSQRGRDGSARRLLLESLEVRSLLATLVVNTAGDENVPDGTLSLREAIEVSNGTLAISALSPQEQVQVSGSLSVPNTIAFNIGSGGPATIVPTSPLPTITAPVVIDGTTQPDYGGTPLIELDGASAGTGADGLTLAAGGSTVQALVINRFNGNGIQIVGPGGNTVAGCFIGTDATGQSAAGNSYAGVLINNSPGNTIGGTSASSLNLISGNGVDGVGVEGSLATGNLIEGNTLGANLATTAPLPNLYGVILASAPGNTVGGLDLAALNVISGNTFSGVYITGAGASGNAVQGNLIGTDFAGETALPNGNTGVEINAAPGNLIGGNTISGNKVYGISVHGSTATGNTIQGNFIGTDYYGTQAVANQGGGIGLYLQSSGTVIGGTTASARNLISGNKGPGITISGQATANLVEGNYIGTNAAGSDWLSSAQDTNSGDGITIDGASNNTIGGNVTGAGNVISGNLGAGVDIVSPADGTDTTGNVVEGNLIGTDATGTTVIFNTLGGVIVSNAIDNTIGGMAPGAGNVISGNTADGVAILRAASTGNTVQGNRIGTDITGTAGLLNTGHGVYVQGAGGNFIGGNVISSNGQGGIQVLGDKTGSGNTIQGNKVGVDITGTQVLSNLEAGINIEESSHELIGGTTPGARNIVSANFGDGIQIVLSSSITVAGNYVGLDGSGTAGLDNSDNGVTVNGSTDVTIGGTTPGAGNVIAGNEKDGILVEFDSSGVLVEGNIVGLDATGINPLSNFGDGVTVDNSSGTTIGGTVPGARNIIAGNAGDGIRFTNFAHGNAVQGNFIGTDVTGATRLANLGNGVEVTGEAEGTTIGGVTAAARNLISGNLGSGILVSQGSGVGNFVQGNFIGTDVTGTKALGNSQYGVLISQSPANQIGGPAAGAGNLIAGNDLDGLFIQGKFSTGNVVQGNLIGTDVTGTQRVGNLGGVSIASGATDNTVGGTTATARNVIAGNLTDGVMISGQTTTGNTVEGNLIGTDANGAHPLGNALDGVFVQDAPGNVIGSAAAGAGNLISGNGQDGLLITNSSASGNIIQGNKIGTSFSGELSLGNGGDGIAIVAALSTQIGGLSPMAGNLISGNALDGISVANVLAAPGQGTTIAGNLIGCDLSGGLALGNGGDGILLDTVTYHVVGGTTPAARNIIAASGQAGIEIQGSGSYSNLIAGNLIGTTAGGDAALGNAIGVNLNGASFNTIGGTIPGAGNLISGNTTSQGAGVGVQILGTGATGNLVEGNFIGTNFGGTRPLANNTGVLISDASGNLVGGSAAGAGNLISGNATSAGDGAGVEITGQNAANNLVLGNLIGTDASGSRVLVAGQSNVGILISNTGGNNQVGGATAGAGNVVSGMQVGVYLFAAQSQFNPTAGSVVAGNKIGTDATGQHALGNNVGIYINGVPGNTIGGATAAARNLVSGNQTGIYVLGTTATGNLIQGNYVGLRADGKTALGNHIGIFLDQASQNTITGNLIAGNLVAQGAGSTGIYFFNGAANNTVTNNTIGTNASGQSNRSLAMGEYGVLLYNAANNAIAKSRGTNRIVGSGIANVREFTGAVPTGTKTAAVSVQGSARSVPAGPAALRAKA